MHTDTFSFKGTLSESAALAISGPAILRSLTARSTAQNGEDCSRRETVICAVISVTIVTLPLRGGRYDVGCFFMTLRERQGFFD